MCIYVLYSHTKKEGPPCQCEEILSCQCQHICTHSTHTLSSSLSFPRSRLILLKSAIKQHGGSFYLSSYLAIKFVISII